MPLCAVHIRDTQKPGTLQIAIHLDQEMLNCLLETTICAIFVNLTGDRTVQQSKDIFRSRISYAVVYRS